MKKENNIGVVKLKENTSLKTKRRLESLLVKEGLFLGWTDGEDGIVVLDLNRAKSVLKVR